MMKSIKKNMDIFEFKKRKVKQVIGWGKKKKGKYTGKMVISSYIIKEDYIFDI